MEDNKNIISLGAIEYRMAKARADIYGGALELGRCLIEAKEGGLVSHGEWEAWVARNAEMSVRSAEKLMKRAREVQDGTALSRLSGSKIDRILALPEDQREDLAAKAEAEGMSTREIEKEVAQLKGMLDAANARADALEADAHRAFADGKKVAEERAQERIDRMHWTMDQQQREIAQAKEDAELAEKRAREAWDEGFKTGQNQIPARDDVDALKAALADKEKRIEGLKTELERTVAFATRANEDKKRLQQQLHDAADDTAREPGVSLAEGARRDVAAFLASAAGQLPYMQGRIDRLGADDLDTLRALVTAVKKWAIATDTILATAGALEVVS
jgi:chromosome segregation ATPase